MLLVKHSPSPPQQKSWVFMAGFGQQIAACQPSLLPRRPGIWGAHFRVWTGSLLFTSQGLGAHYLLSPVGHLYLQLHPFVS